MGNIVGYRWTMHLHDQCDQDEMWRMMKIGRSQKELIVFAKRQKDSLILVPRPSGFIAGFTYAF